MTKNLCSKLTACFAVVVCWLTLCGCVYDSPITAKPTRKADAGFLGNWTSQDGKVKMKVGKYDEDNYVLIYDGQLYHAWASDVEGMPFFSVQSLDSTEDGAYKFTYSSWKLADDGTLHGRIVNDKIVPDDTKGSAAVQKLLKANLKNPDLLGEEIVFVKDK
jgi:hypothetical protein